jgi:WD40 repeat protein
VTRSRGDAARCDLIALHPDGETLYVVFEGGVWSYNLRVEDLLPFSGGKRAHFYRAPHGISAVAFSPDGRYLAQGIFSGNVLVRDYSKVTSDPLVREPSPRADKHLPSPGHTHYVKVVAVGPDGKALSGGDDNVIRRWDVARPADGKASGSIEWVLDDLAVSPNGKKYVTTESSEGATGCARNVWSASTGQRLVAADKTVYADRSTFSPDGKLIAGCGRGTDTVVLYDAETGQQVHKFPAVGVSRDRPTFSRDGKLLAVATFETKRVVVWTVRTGEEFASWTDDRPMTAVAFRPDGKWIATGGEAGAISLWEVGTATKKRVWEGHAGAITRLAFTPDGRALVSSGVDGTIRVWAPEQPRAVEVIPLGPPSKPITFDLDPSGKYLFAAGQTPLVFIVRLPDLREPADASSPSPPIPGGDESQKADSDPFRAGSVWVGAEGDKQMTLTVTERTGAFFKARLIAGDEVDRVLSGTVGGGKVKWAAKDVQGLKGGRGLDNEGVFGRDENGTDRLDFTYRPTGAAQPAGAFVLRIKTTRSEPLDPDRAAAVFVLSSGGGVRVNNEERTIRAVADLPPNAFRLTWVDFHSGNVTDKDFQVFAGCQELTFMQLRCPKLGDAGLSYFKGCKKLQNLELYHTQVTDDGLAVFAGCTHLKVLILNDCRRVGNAGMAQFKNCGELTKLEIPHTQVTDQGLTWFKDFKNFYEIRMENTHVGGDGLTAFKNSPVRFLWLTDCKKIDDAALVLLKQFKLEAVLLRGTSVTAAGVAALRASLPNCKVDWVEPKKPIGPAVEPNTNLDPDRAAAEYVISIGGTIRINGSERGLEDPVPDRNTFPWQPRSPDANRDINLAAKLPAEAFELTWVELRDNKRADDQVLEKLKGCKSLLYLGLQGTTVTDAGVKNLGECKNLRQVNLCLTGIGDSGLEGLKPCTKITALGLGDTQVTDKGLSLFKGSECLTHICLQNTKVTDVGVSHLTAAKSLESIDLNRTAVSDKGVWFLRGCKDLRMAALVFTQVTKRGLDELKSTFPECRIITR